MSFNPCRAVRRGVCGFAEDPSRSALSARLFWDARHNPRVIEAKAEPARSTDRFSFDLLSQPAAATVLLEPAGAQQLLLNADGRTIQIALTDGSWLDGPVRLSFDLLSDTHFDRRLLALTRWSAFLRLGRFPARLFAAPRQAPRWTEAIRFANAMAGAPTVRDVAAQILGRDAVEQDWNHESDYLRAKVRRRIKAARALADGGYLGMLEI